MWFTREQRFLYTRIAILVAMVGWIASAFAGLKGFSFWYGGFVLCFWVAFGLINYQHKSSLWLLHTRPWIFALFYAALAGASFLADQFGLNAHLWFYPLYRGLGFAWVWLVLYPFGGLAVLELLYFLAGYLDEPFRFRQLPMTKWHGFFDITEHLLFLAMIAVIVKGAVEIGWSVAMPTATLVASLWMLAALVKLRFHIRHIGHYTLIIIVVALLAALSHELPNTIAREWVYLEAPFLNLLFLGLPLWVWLGWFWLTLVPLRLWIFIALHPKVP